MSIKAGDTAPDFTLKNSKGTTITLSSILNEKRVVLLFYPLAFTSTCTEELCTMRDNMKLYESLDAEILGISVDSHYVLREYKRSHNLNFPLLSDFNKEASQKYGVLYDDFYGMKGVSKRASFVIGRDGIVKYAEILEDADDLPDFNAINKTLQLEKEEYKGPGS